MFAGWSKSWGGGGSAVVDPAPDRPTTLARGYLITTQQFQDVLAQESWRDIGDEVDLGPAVEHGSAVLGPGHYDRVLCVGHRHGYPMLTFTTPKRLEDLEPHPPAAAYESTIVTGLMESHGITEAESRAYVRDHVAPSADPHRGPIPRVGRYGDGHGRGSGRDVGQAR